MQNFRTLGQPLLGKSKEFKGGERNSAINSSHFALPSTTVSCKSFVILLYVKKWFNKMGHLPTEISKERNYTQSVSFEEKMGCLMFLPVIKFCQIYSTYKTILMRLWDYGR